MKYNLFKDVKRLIVKIGTSVMSEKNKLNQACFNNLSGQVAQLLKEKIEVIVVSSGAICAGMDILGLKNRPKDLPLLQATAAVGQNVLMRMWEKAFGAVGIKVAQILLTKDDLINRKRYLNARNTLNALLRRGVVPIVNENDTVSVDEIKFGDNDYLSSLVANLADAQLLIILSDVDGLYAKGSGLIKVVERITPAIEALACGTTKEISVGGMSSKIEAAKIATNSGISVVVHNGATGNVLIKILREGETGTLFLPKAKLDSKKRWIAYGSRTSGQLVVDEGAKIALLSKGKSLLSSGIVESKGDFKTGDIVSIVDIKGREYARGLTNYSTEEIKKIKGLNSSLIEKTLGYKYYDEVIHRDNLVIL
ncbi:MAG: glutamate 5-kinase [Candidatus Omnitrophota bacterium]